MANMDKPYAVIKFLSDNSYSEIPTLWLIYNNNNCNHECWWPPRAANCATLINHCAHPNHGTWKRYQVDIVKYCSSVESARKSASDANYQTTDEERFGRGKRSHIHYSRCSSDEESKTTHENTKKRKSSNPISTSPFCPDTLSLQYSNASISNASSHAVASTSQHEPEIESHIEMESHTAEVDNINLNNIPIIIPGYNNNNNAPEVEIINNNSNIKEMLQQILRMLAVLNVSHKEVKQRLAKLENVVKTSYQQKNSECQDFEILQQYIPFATIDSIREFENALHTKEIEMQFRQLILRTGGNNPKDSMHRNLKKIFSNECAMQCSWKGLRNNFRVSNLKVINILKREVTSQFTLTETKFDNIASEWFRFAKQRKERTDKAKEKEME